MYDNVQHPDPRQGRSFEKKGRCGWPFGGHIGWATNGGGGGGDARERNMICLPRS
jgi:hypothetical protein